MCAICVAAQDATPPTGDGVTADAWAQADAAIKAWRAANPDLEFDSVLEECEAWAAHIDATTVERPIN